MTTQEELDEVQAAITACLAGEEVTIRGRTVRRPRLSDLYEARRELINQLSAEGSSMSSLAQVDRTT